VGVIGALLIAQRQFQRQSNSFIEPSFFAFRDRDFDAQPPVNIQLIQLFSNKPVFLSHRACIEKY
jgi:hypothetical protein